MTATATAPRRPSTLRTPEEERAYHLGFAELCRERGYPNLARSHQMAGGLCLPEETRRANLAASWMAWREARGEDEPYLG